MEFYPEIFYELKSYITIWHHVFGFAHPDLSNYTNAVKHLIPKTLTPILNNYNHKTLSIFEYYFWRIKKITYFYFEFQSTFYESTKIH